MIIKVYIFIAILSYLFIYAAGVAYFEGEFPNVKSPVKDRIFMLFWSILAASFWPIFVPVMYFIKTEKLKHGLKF